MCLRFQFCTHQRVCILYFLKKGQIRCNLMYIEDPIKKHSEKMVKIRQQGFLKLNFEIIQKKHIFWFLTKHFASHG
jgi:hypothetical protein